VVRLIRLFRRHALLGRDFAASHDGLSQAADTARFALGNLHGFDPEKDAVPEEAMQEIDRWYSLNSIELQARDEGL